MRQKKESLWYRLWDHKSEQEKKHLKSFLPLILYTIAFVYFVLYLSILNTINRDKTAVTVKNWFGGDPPAWVTERMREKQDIKDSFKLARKRVSGGR